MSAQVLVVEDSPTLRRLLMHQVTASGYEALAACDGQEAVNAIAENRAIALILMDIMMPVLDGYEATKQIRKMEKEKNLHRVPIVAVTCLDDSVACFEVGMDDFHRKPINQAQLKELLAKWVPATEADPMELSISGPQPRLV